MNFPLPFFRFLSNFFRLKSNLEGFIKLFYFFFHQGVLKGVEKGGENMKVVLYLCSACGQVLCSRLTWQELLNHPEQPLWGHKFDGICKEVEFSEVLEYLDDEKEHFRIDIVYVADDIISRGYTWLPYMPRFFPEWKEE